MRYLTLGLPAPAPRLLFSLGVLQFMPHLQKLELVINNRMQPWLPQHNQALAAIATIPKVLLRLRQVRLLEHPQTRLGGAVMVEVVT